MPSNSYLPPDVFLVHAGSQKLLNPVANKRSKSRGGLCLPLVIMLFGFLMIGVGFLILFLLPPFLAQLATNEENNVLTTSASVVGCDGSPPHGKSGGYFVTYQFNYNDKVYTKRIGTGNDCSVYGIENPITIRFYPLTQLGPVLTRANLPAA